jgi:hypothetical protein
MFIRGLAMTVSDASLEYSYQKTEIEKTAHTILKIA